MLIEILFRCDNRRQHLYGLVRHGEVDFSSTIKLTTNRRVTAFMPIPLLWNVKLNRNAKISVAGVLGLGFFASLSACVRLRYTIGLTEQENYLGECNIAPETPP